jgi:hypothetical protein
MKSYSHYRGRSQTASQRNNCKVRITVAESKLRQRLKKLRSMFPAFRFDPVKKKIVSIYQHSVKQKPS